MSNEKYTPKQPSYMDPIYYQGYNKMIEYKEGNVLITEDRSQYLVTKQAVAMGIDEDGNSTEFYNLKYINIDDYTMRNKPDNITKVYNTINDLIAGNDPIWERTKWIRMSEVEAKILEGITVSNHPYIARGTNGALYLFRSKPIRNTFTLGTGFIVEYNNMSHRVSFCMFNRLFKFIKNHQCYKVEDLQNGILKEVELESDNKGKDEEYDNY